ncbi:MAG: hypothetical protein ABIT05_04660 [Chitinophagaceae bacterium]
MKKLLLTACLLTGSLFIYAQKDTGKTKVMMLPPQVQVSGTIVYVPAIKVFERPNYQGRSASFTKDATGKFIFPFPVQHVSIRIPDSLILYIKTCFEFASENAYTSSLADISLETLCGIRTDVKAHLRVTLNGISTSVHNNDCLRFAGDINVRVLETSPDETAVESQMRWTVIERGAARVTTGPFMFPIFTGSASVLSDSRYAIELNKGFVFNNNPVPQLTEQGHYGSRIMQNSTNVFIVGRSALQSGRVKVWVKTDLTSSHKNCNLCDDFSANVKMAEPGFASIPFNKTYDGGKVVDAAHPYVVLGPYPAHGSRAGFAITASNGVDKDFRVHLKVNAE